MTESEYYRLYKQARSQSALISLRAKQEIRSLYLKASKEAADKLRDALDPRQRELSEIEWNELSRQLQPAKLTLTDGLTAIAVSTVAAGAILYPNVNASYLKANIKSASITDSGLDKLASLQTRRAVESMSTRTYGTGHTFSTRVWNAREDWEANIRKIVEEGIRIGRDPAKIAKDVQIYTAEGRVALANRWAQIERGTPGWYNRLPKNLDWRGVRLVRSELQATIQAAQVESGEQNPGATGEYRWVLGAGLDHCPECIDNASRTYTKDNVPGIEHPNCLIAGTKVDTPNGPVDIENIRPGDKVISRTGEIVTVSKTWRSAYNGPVIEVTTESGIITMTPDHPVISGNRWISAKSLKNGYNLLRVQCDIPSTVRAEKNSMNGPTISGENGSFFSVLSLLSPIGVPVTAVNFNGKFYVFERKVDVILRKSKIGKRIFARYFQRIVHKFFIDGKTFALARDGALAKFRERTLDSSNCVMTRTCCSLPAVSIKPFIPFGNGRLFVSMLGKKPINNRSRNSEFLSYLIDREILVPKQFVNSSLGYVKSFTHSERIISLQHLHVNADVYNLSVTGDNSYIANGFASHNCGCSVEPILRDRAQFVKDLKSWESGDINSDNRYIDQWYTNVYQPAQGK